jgi:hypothetical protein
MAKKSGPKKVQCEDNATMANLPPLQPGVKKAEAETKPMTQAELDAYEKALFGEPKVWEDSDFDHLPI